MIWNRVKQQISTQSSAHHAQDSSSFADGRHQVLIEDLILWGVELL